MIDRRAIAEDEAVVAFARNGKPVLMLALVAPDVPILVLALVSLALVFLRLLTDHA